eukprot:CAMPEP_0185586798 /NCGR_PEP_ID=MMETSP0434-20130131/46171_1 /TAXON_ID=626734 ORGANISM="Favella taraikaensis, Strain Fe Narragansett Bay" /NCGR_SAMPLE_ID=MMETSP0434 /ASSEMBLY_ACC=CAM_ASM_000379 /LENGTH=55 /DNA_ID=CAMNT_0028208195 /DNA_START=252 /DNA_END=419 /DNA_ORIENTATION=+
MNRSQEESKLPLLDAEQNEILTSEQAKAILSLNSFEDGAIQEMGQLPHPDSAEAE